MKTSLLTACLLLALGTGAQAQDYQMTIHLRSGETVTIAHDAIERIMFDLGPTGVPGQGSAPAAVQLLRNFPNPFNPSTTIAYEIPAAAVVTVRVFDLHGALIAELLHESQPAGRHEVTWDGTDGNRSPMASGVYVYAVACGGVTLSQRLMLVK